MIEVYWDRVKALLDRYAVTPFVVDVAYTCETRPGSQGYFSGSVTFIDNSALHFGEFLDSTPAAVERLMYAYHYCDAEGNLIWRYDNARHRPPLASTHHRHTPKEVTPSDTPGLDDVLAEIASLKGWLS